MDKVVFVSASIYLKVGKSAKDGAREAQGAWTIGHEGHTMSRSHLHLQNTTRFIL
jgi:transposase-like protein